MLEISRIKEQKNEIIELLKIRGFDAKDIIESVLSLDIKWRNSKSELDDVASELNKIAKEIGMLFGQGKVEEANAAKAKTSNLKENLKHLVKLLLILLMKLLTSCMRFQMFLIKLFHLENLMLIMK